MNAAAVQRVIVWIAKGCLFIVPFIPLYVSKVLFFPYITGKAFVFRTLTEIAFAAWIFLIVFFKEYRPRQSPLFIALGGFILIATLATIFGVNPQVSFWSNYERMEGLVTYLHLFAYFVVMAHVFRQKDWHIFFHLFIIAGVFENIYALLQRFGVLPSPQGGINRVDGTIGNPTYLAAYLTFVLFVAAFLWFQFRAKRFRYFYAAVMLWTLITVYFTATRGAALAIIGGMILFLFSYLILIKPAHGLKRNLMFFAIALCILVPSALWFFKETAFVSQNPVLSRLTSISLTERTIVSRFTIWRMSWSGFQERPLLGWGPGNYSVVFSRYYHPALWRQEPWFDRSHNIVFDWLINAGIPGLFAYFGILISAVYLVWDNYFKKKIQVEEAALISILFLVYLFQNFFVFDQIATYISFFAVLAYIHNIAVMRRESLARKKEVDFKNAPLAGVFLAVPLVLLTYFINIKPLSANVALLNAMKAQGQDFQKALVGYEKALSYDTLGKEEVKEQFIRFAVSVGVQPQIEQGFRETVLRRAIEEAQKGVAENPLDPRAYLFLANVYSRVGFFDNAIEVLNGALALSPQRQQILFELADVYIKKSDYPSAIRALETAFNADPSFNTARMNLAAVHILNNEQDKADALLREGYGGVDVADEILVQVYSNTKNYERLIGVWKAFVESSPSDIQYRRNLAGAYLLAGRKNEAIRVLEEMIELDPGFKTEGESYIKQIRLE